MMLSVKLKNNLPKQLIALAYLLTLSLSLVISPQLVAKTSAIATQQNRSKQPIPLNELRAFSEAYYQIKSNYVDTVDDSVLLQAAIKGMVASLDKHSRYLPADEYAIFNSSNLGEYAGIGLSFNEHKFGIEVAEVIKNSPAARAGILTSMLVTHVNKHAIQFMPKDEVYTMLKGEVGTSVMLTVASKSFAKPKDIVLQREIVLLESITSQRLPDDTAYIHISQFTLNSVFEFETAIAELNLSTPVKNLIIDLRDNPGGVLEAALELSDLFITEGKLLVSNGRTADAKQTFYASADAPLANLKVVIVINRGSASASEILAVALHDHNKATLLGETSYGKGSIQTIIPLTLESGMKLTSAEYFSPLGKKIQDVGIKPDVFFKQAAAKQALQSESSMIKSNPYNVSLLDDPQLLQAYNLFFHNNQH